MNDVNKDSCDFYDDFSSMQISYQLSLVLDAENTCNVDCCRHTSSGAVGLCAWFSPAEGAAGLDESSDTTADEQQANRQMIA